MDNKQIEETYLKWIMPSIRSRAIGFSDFRIKKAKEQYDRGKDILSNMTKEKHKEAIIGCVKAFLTSIGMTLGEYDPKVELKRDRVRGKIDYADIYEKNKPKGMKEKEDIVWIKFTTEGLISVIGVGCDIFFSDNTKNNTTSGRILTSLNSKFDLKLEWDDKEVLIFPLRNIPEGLNRSDIESGIGNFLISGDIPILDFYSHNY